MARPKDDRTKYEILQCATKMFLEKGYTDTYVTTLAKTLKISTGLLTFWFPTKEHILAELVKELFAFQWESQKNEEDPTAAYLCELAMIASISEDNPQIRDLILAVYTHARSIAIVRQHDTQRSREIFGAYCADWTETDYMLAENAASGVERAMLVTENTEGIPFTQRLRGSLDAILKLYDVPKEERDRLLTIVMATDYRNRGQHIFEAFSGFVAEKVIRNRGGKA